MKRLLLALFLMLSLNSVLGMVINESSLAELGYENFEIMGANIEKCTEMNFVLSFDLNEGVYPVFSLHSSFGPGLGKEAKINIYLNDDENEVADIALENLGNGWARIDLPRKKLKEVNVLKICGKTSSSITNITILNDSAIGNYSKPDFLLLGAFTKTISKEKPKVGEEFDIIVSLRNFGSEGANVSIKYREPELENEMPQIKIIRGETYLTSVIPKCRQRDVETKCIEPGIVSFKYTVKVADAMQMTLLPAILTYTNIFGEETAAESNRLTITVVQPEIKLKAYLLVGKDLLLSGEKTWLKLIVKNEGVDPLYNIVAGLDADEALTVEGKTLMEIGMILPNKTLEFDFNITATAAGSYAVGCNLTYLDYNVIETDCNRIIVEFKEKEIGPVIMGAGVLLFIGIIVYVYFSLKK